jgi:hypothetical protein
VRLRIRKGSFTSHVNGMTSDGQNSVAAIVRNLFCAVSQSTVSRYITEVVNAVNQSAN